MKIPGRTPLLIVAGLLTLLLGICLPALGMSDPLAGLKYVAGSIATCGMLGMAVTANQVIERASGCRKSFPVAASTTIYEGSLVFVNASGYADDDTASGANVFAGVAITEQDNGTGSNGDLNVECFRDGDFKLTGSGFAQSSVGLDVYATDNYTLSLTATGDAVRIGKITEYISSTKVMVSIDCLNNDSPKFDGLTLQTLTFNGATTANVVTIPTNLADALSLVSSAGDILVVDTTTGAVAITVTTSAASGLTLAGHTTIGDAKNIILNTTTGTKIGTAVGQKLGFWNATPVVQPASANQAALTNSTGGSADGTLAAVTDTSMSDQSGTINNNFTDVHTLLGAIRTALVDTGLIKGAA